jgi:hypothetical protein
VLPFEPDVDDHRVDHVRVPLIEHLTADSGQEVSRGQGGQVGRGAWPRRSVPWPKGERCPTLVQGVGVTHLRYPVLAGDR